jgi:hypothetical protein
MGLNCWTIQALKRTSAWVSLDAEDHPFISHRSEEVFQRQRLCSSQSHFLVSFEWLRVDRVKNPSPPQGVLVGMGIFIGQRSAVYEDQFPLTRPFRATRGSPSEIPLPSRPPRLSASCFNIIAKFDLALSAFSTFTLFLPHCPFSTRLTRKSLINFLFFVRSIFTFLPICSFYRSSLELQLFSLRFSLKRGPPVTR